MKLLVAFILACLSALAQLTLRPADWVDIAVRMRVPSGTATSITWGMSVPKAFQEPAIVVNAGAVTCKQKKANCTLTGIFPTGFDGAVATYRYTMPSGTGPYTLRIALTSIRGGSAVLSLASGIQVSISPAVVNVKPGGTVQFTATVIGTSNTGWETPNPPRAVPPPDTVTIAIRP